MSSPSSLFPASPLDFGLLVAPQASPMGAIDPPAPPELVSRSAPAPLEPIAIREVARRESAPAMDGPKTDPKSETVFFVPFEVFHALESETDATPLDATPIDEEPMFPPLAIVFFRGACFQSKEQDIDALCTAARTHFNLKSRQFSLYAWEEKDNDERLDVRVDTNKALEALSIDGVTKLRLSRGGFMQLPQSPPPLVTKQPRKDYVAVRVWNMRLAGWRLAGWYSGWRGGFAVCKFISERAQRRHPTLVRRCECHEGYMACRDQGRGGA